MHLTVKSFNPFIVSFTLYNLLGEVDGHPLVTFRMATGEYMLQRHMTFRNLTSMAADPWAGEKIVIQDPTMQAKVHALVMERVRSASFHEPWATRRYNPWNPGYRLDWRWPRRDRDFRHNYLFFVLEDIGDFITQDHYDQLEQWYQSLPSFMQLDEQLENLCTIKN